MFLPTLPRAGTVRREARLGADHAAHAVASRASHSSQLRGCAAARASPAEIEPAAGLRTRCIALGARAAAQAATGQNADLRTARRVEGRKHARARLHTRPRCFPLPHERARRARVGGQGALEGPGAATRSTNSHIFRPRPAQRRGVAAPSAHGACVAVLARARDRWQSVPPLLRQVPRVGPSAPAYVRLQQPLRCPRCARVRLPWHTSLRAPRAPRRDPRTPERQYPSLTPRVAPARQRTLQGAARNRGRRFGGASVHLAWWRGGALGRPSPRDPQDPAGPPTALHGACGPLRALSFAAHLRRTRGAVRPFSAAERARICALGGRAARGAPS